ncbi:MAG: OmpA family protein [Bacteroidota bacterium]
MMRVTLPATLLLSALLAACASTKDASPGKHLSQSGPLKVHPGLLGQPVPAELQETRPTDSAAPASRTEAPIKMDETGLRTQRSVYFDLDSATVKEDYQPALQAHGRYLASHPQARVRIEGNADERGSSDHNARLGLKRAENVRQSIISQGAAEKQVSIKTLGESRPKLKGHDEESWAENRRSDVVYEKEN